MRNTLMPNLTFLSRSFAILGLVSTVAACGGSKWHETKEKFPDTGDRFSEPQKAPVGQPAFRPGDQAFTVPDQTPARETPKQPAAEAPDHLDPNDRIEVTNPNPEGDDDSVEAVVIDTKRPGLKGKKVFVKKDRISHAPVVPSNEKMACDKYFMVQNIATEKVRLYANCAEKDASGECVHKMVLETDMTAGEETPDQSRRTILGSYRVGKWAKFYEDSQHFFPSFYAAGYPKLPDRDKDASLDDWMSSTLLPRDGGVMRGSFGWYTAKLEPNANAQWTHGTFGWGKDGGKFIAASKDASNANKMDVRSQGCTRVENQAIALFREVMPECAHVVKVYAREALSDKTRARYQTSSPALWSWVLTKKNGKDAPKSGAKYAPSAKTNADEILDHGTYRVDQTPDAVAFDMTKDARTENNGNVYGLPKSSMHGVFLIDEGRFANYEHPSELKVMGFGDHKLPTMMISTRKVPAAAAVEPVAAKPAVAAPAVVAAPPVATVKPAAPVAAPATTGLTPAAIPVGAGAADASADAGTPPPVDPSLAGLPQVDFSN